jgi:hypothetical protein
MIISIYITAYQAFVTLKRVANGIRQIHSHDLVRTILTQSYGHYLRDL